MFAFARACKESETRAVAKQNRRTRRCSSTQTRTHGGYTEATPIQSIQWRILRISIVIGRVHYTAACSLHTNDRTHDTLHSFASKQDARTPARISPVSKRSILNRRCIHDWTIAHVRTGLAFLSGAERHYAPSCAVSDWLMLSASAASVERTVRREAARLVPSGPVA